MMVIIFVLSVLSSVNAKNINVLVTCEPDKLLERDDLLKSLSEQSIVETEMRLDFPDFNCSSIKGSWTLFPLINLVSEQAAWTLVVQPSTRVFLSRLFEFVKTLDYNTPLFIGKGLVDQRMSIIHHFYGYQDNNLGEFLYPSFRSGFLLSRSFVEKIKPIIPTTFTSSFSIDAKHEFAKFAAENIDVKLTDYPDLFCAANAVESIENCITLPISTNLFERSLSKSKDDVQFAVKTYHGYHFTRVPIVREFWAHDLPHLVFVSDVVDEEIPTVTYGLNNTERGHCAKTFEIIRRFAQSSGSQRWLFIADDDTLLSVPRLLKLLSMYDDQEEIIVGERYGFGFSRDGKSGYDYPTGGAGMGFTKSAAVTIIKSCDCPAPDYPDDMVIGMCASATNVPIFHYEGFHQAQPKDYSIGYLSESLAISFHKFEDVNVGEVFENYLNDHHDEHFEL